MGPKKDKNKSKLKCPYYNRGFCKHGEECPKNHPDKVCEDTDCFSDDCDKRHPNPCKFGKRCVFKRKKICVYSHVTTGSDDGKVDALENKFNKKFEVLENKTDEIYNTIEQKFADKFKQFETKICNLQKDLEIKNSQINSIEMRMKELEETNQTHFKKQEKKIKDLESVCKQKNKKEKIPVITEEKDSETKIYTDTSIKCGKCDFTTTSRQGLKIHMSRLHSKINFDQFPAACDICEKVFDNDNIMKKHKKKDHTFHFVKYQCNECDFMANEPETLNVHFGTKHSTKKQCGLCDKNFKSFETLDDHLSQCEIFMCSNSGCRDYFVKLTEVREHIQNEHRKNSPEHYSFSYWIIHAKDKSAMEINKKSHTIYPKDWETI